MQFASKTALMLACSALSCGSQAFELPLWKSEAEALGYTLPEAFGISVGYMNVEQGINVDSIDFEGLVFVPDLPFLPSIPIPTDAIDIATRDSFQKSEVFTVRADMWLFPFLNFYAIGGKIKGFSQTTIDVAINNSITGGQIPVAEDLPFKLDLDGNMYGGGIVLAGGYENWFTIVDASMTKTNLTVIDGGIDSLVITPRIGYDLTRTGTPLRLWVGAQYQDIQQSLSGNIGDLDLPTELANLLDLVNKDNEGRFNVEQSLATEWAPVFGFQYTFNPTFNLIGEFSVGERESVFITLDTRF